MAKKALRKLPTWRREQGLTQREAAAHFGVSRQSWVRWENGDVPSERFICALYAAGACEPNDFYDLPPPPAQAMPLFDYQREAA